MDIRDLGSDDLKQITEEHQTRMCELCETHIIGSKNKTKF